MLVRRFNVERLLRLPSPLFPIQDYINCGIGGDKIQHIAWRMQNGSLPKQPSKVIIWGGTNNISNSSSKQARQITGSVINMVGHITTINPSCSIAAVGILPLGEPDKCMQANQINTLLRLKLPAGVTFIEPPEEFFDNGSYNRKYFKDKVHLNNKGYSIMLEHFYEFASSNVSSLLPFIYPHIHTGDSASTLSTLNDYAIGEPEFMGRGWNGESLN